MAAVLALLAPASARAHNAFSLQAAQLTTAAPTLDGVMQPGEWASATTTTFDGVPDNGQFWVMHDGTDVYVAFRRVDATPGSIPRFQLYFDNGHDGALTTGDDSWSLGVNLPVGPVEVIDSFYDGAGGNPPDSTNAGTNDTQGSATHTVGEFVAEFKHPRCTTDISHDVCIPINGDPVGVTFYYIEDSNQSTAVFRPAAFSDQANFGHLTLAPLVTSPPETTIDSAPVDYVQTAAATFEFSSNQAGTFDCSLDGAPFASCSSPHPLSGLAEGPHSFEVRATNTGGQQDASPAIHRWSVDTVAPIGGSLDQHQGVIIRTDGGMSLGGTTDQHLGQVVSASTTGLLQEVRVAIKCATGVTTVATVEIQEVDGSPTGTVLATATAQVDSDAVYRRFVLDTPVQVTAGGEYAIVLSADSNIVACFVPGTPVTGPYGGAMYFRDSTNPTWQISTEDLPFATFVSSAAAGDTGTIAFSSTRDGDLDIYTLDLVTSAVTQITNAAGEDLSASYSGDGSTIVFSSERDGDAEIFVVDAGGGTPTQLTNNTVFDGFPAFSPDGQTISFRSDRDGSGDLWLMDADGTNPRQLTTTAADVSHFNSTWSPDSQTIAFHRREANGNDEIYTIAATGGAAANITNTPSEKEERPNWSNDGAWILFDDIVAGSEGIWRMNPDGSNRVRLTTSGIRGDFSPDGTRIVFETLGAGELMTASATDGSGLLNVTNNAADDVDPDWRPDVAPANPLVVTNTNNSGLGSLRGAILAANAAEGPDTITFAIPTPGPYLISLTGELPSLTGPVTIDGTTQPGWIGPPVIQVDGSGLEFADGLEVFGGSSTIRGLMLTNFEDRAVTLGSNGNTLAGNYIGTDGFSASEGSTAVYVSGSNNVVGGTTPANRNVLVAGNRVVRIESGCFEGPCPPVSNNLVQGNYVGTNAAGNAALGDPFSGIYLAGPSSTTIEDNVIGGAGHEGGIYVESTSGPTFIKRNLIGVAANGVSRLPNDGPGIQIEDSGVVVGGSASDGNVIAYNGQVSVDTGVVVSSGSGNTISANSIYDNVGLGIFVGGEANDDQPAPVLEELLIGTGITVRGSLDSVGDATYRLEFFSSRACDASGFGEGRSFLGFQDVTTDEVGDASFTVNFPNAPLDAIVTATATNANGSTSEFSACVEEGLGGEATGDIVLESDERAAAVGAKVVDLDDVPSNQLPSFAGGPNSAPVGSIPVGSIPVGSIPVGSIPVGSIPVGSIPVGSIGLNAIPVGSIGLEQVLLSMLPIDADALLEGTPLFELPRQAITLADIYANATTRARFDALTLADSGLAQSILGGVPFIAFLLGDATLNQLPAPDAATWCEAIQDAGGTCTGVSGTNTVMGLSISGIPVGSIPVGSIPVGSIPVGSIPVGSIPVGSIDLEASRLAAIPVGSISNANRPLVVECGNACPTGWTLGDADEANAILPGAQLKHLVGAFPNDLTLNDLMLGIVPRSALAWESLPIDGFQLFDETGVPNTVRYRLTFTTPCPLPSDLSVRVKLPEGWLYKTGSTRWRYGTTATPIDGAEPTTSSKAGARWTSLPGAPCAGGATSREVQLSFQALSGFSLGTEEATATVTMNGASEQASGDAPVLVRQNWEANDSPANAPEIAKDTLVIGHIAAAGDREVFRLPIPTARGTRTTFLLSHIAENADFDLTIGKPVTDSLQSNPVGSIPVGSIPVEDFGTSVDDSGDALPPETLQDIPVGSIPVGSISATRGSADEVAQVVADGEDGFYTIVVSGYNGSHSEQPFVLRVVQQPPPTLPPCQPRNLSLGAPGTLPTGPLDSNTNTLFVVNKQRLAALYPGQDVNLMLDAATAVASSTGIVGSVLPVDGNQAVRDAYAAWDANPCGIGNANDVVAAINAVIASYRTTLPNLKYVVLFGTDEALPMARMLDTVTISNEMDEAADLFFTTATANGTRANALYSAAALGYYLSDNSYGAFTTVPWLGRELYLPNVAVGRLVESPEDIRRQLQLYLDAGGVLSPTNTLTTGYDFLTDGAQAIAAALTAMPAAVANVDTALIDDTWDAAALEAAFTDKSPPDDILSVNAHYSHWLLQPATGSTLVKTSDLPALPTDPDVEPAFARRILFTMGCHGGLNVADTLLAGAGSIPAFRDWVQGYAKQQAAVYVANTGFGYGDTEANALSERLMSIFAEKLAQGGVIGERWVDALHEYFGTAGLYGVYDEKALTEATFYGLPFWQLPGTVTPPASDPAPTEDPGAGDFLAADETIEPTLIEHTTDRGRFWSANGETLAIHYRPIQPRVSRDVTRAGHVATGALITELRTEDVFGVDPVNATPLIDESEHEPERNFEPQIFPAGPVALTRSTSRFEGDRQHAVVIAGQFRPGGGGTERLVRRIGLEVAYVQNQTDFTAPLIEQVAAVHTSSATIFVRASEDAPGGVVRAAALWSDGTLNVDGTLQWNFVWLDQVTGGWSALVHPANEPIQVIAMAQNANGLVAYSANKGVNFPSVADAGGPEVLVESPAPGGEYFLGQVVPLSFACSDAGVVTSCSASPSASPIDTATVGPKTITVTATDLANNTTTVEIDYTVVYNFTGFFQPVSNPPYMNQLKAGQAVPLKFSLAGDQGLAIFTTGYPASRQITCDTSAPIDGDVPTTTAGSSSLLYVARGDYYQYLWKTEKSWANTCRRLIFTFNDGKERHLDFKFTR